MKPVRAFYDRLSPTIRTRIRAVLPDWLLRWYAHHNTDIYLLSYPKCGRTWLRLMMGKAISLQFSLPENEEILFLRTNKRWHPEAPRITVIHDDHPMLKTPQELEQSKARYRNKKVIFLVRDPRDVIVSSYFEMSKRGQIFGDNPHETRKAIFTGSLADFINHPTGGFDTIIEYYNIWERNRHTPKGFLLLRYEDLRANPHAELRHTLDFTGLNRVSESIIDQAIEYASFENMRKMEAENKFQSGILNPADKADPDSYKTRKGKIKGFTDHLNPSEIEALNQKLRTELSDFFGYRP
jgi:hypothetical protein